MDKPLVFKDSENNIYVTTGKATRKLTWEVIGTVDIQLEQPVM
jgi:hypothetical protein